MALLQASLDKASRELRDIEMDFLLNGVVISAESFAQPREEEKPEPEFRFVEHKAGAPLIVIFR